MNVTGEQRQSSTPPGRLRLLQFIKCLFIGHEFRTSRTYENCKTCNRCKYRIRG